MCQVGPDVYKKSAFIDTTGRYVDSNDISGPRRRSSYASIPDLTKSKYCMNILLYEYTVHQPKERTERNHHAATQTTVPHPQPTGHALPLPGPVQRPLRLPWPAVGPGGCQTFQPTLRQLQRVGRPVRSSGPCRVWPQHPPARQLQRARIQVAAFQPGDGAGQLHALRQRQLGHQGF